MLPAFKNPSRYLGSLSTAPPNDTSSTISRCSLPMPLSIRAACQRCVLREPLWWKRIKTLVLLLLSGDIWHVLDWEIKPKASSDLAITSLQPLFYFTKRVLPAGPLIGGKRTRALTNMILITLNSGQEFTPEGTLGVY